MRIKLQWAACFLLAASFPLLAISNDKVHIVRELLVEVDGNTSVSAIKAYLRLKEGDSFSSEEELIEAAGFALQDLINYRVFRNTSMNVEEISGNDEQTEWRVRFYVKDAWTIVPIPYPKYDSNTGLRLGLKTFYDNAFGTMSDIYLGLGMNIAPNSNGEWEVGEWSINPRWSNIRFGNLKFSVNYLQAYEEKKFDSSDSSRAFNYGYSRSEIALGSSVPLFDTGVTYSFSIAFNMKYDYKNFLNTQNFNEEPFSTGWNHGISYGRVDWRNNFRQGQNVGLGHGINLIINPETNQYYPINNLTLTGGIYRILGKRFNYYGKASSFLYFGSPNAGIASELRGIADDEMSGNWGIHISNSLAFQFWRLEGIWDAQVHPFIDIGLASPFEGANLNRDLEYSAGLDFVLYLDAIPNLVARGMIGVNLGKYEWSDPSKYEFTITSSLLY